MLCTMTFSSTTPASQVSAPVATTIAVTPTAKGDQRRGDTAVQDQQDRYHQRKQDQFDTRERDSAPTSLVAANAAAWPTR